jgi:hypothetical protein
MFAKPPPSRPPRPDAHARHARAIPTDARLLLCDRPFALPLSSASHSQADEPLSGERHAARLEHRVKLGEKLSMPIPASRICSRSLLPRERTAWFAMDSYSCGHQRRVEGSATEIFLCAARKSSRFAHSSGVTRRLVRICWKGLIACHG